MPRSFKPAASAGPPPLAAATSYACRPPPSGRPVDARATDECHHLGAHLCRTRDRVVGEPQLRRQRRVQFLVGEMPEHAPAIYGREAQDAATEPGHAARS